MKAITLWQPWATLIALQEKPYETRHWPTSYRGKIAIHASKKWDNEIISYVYDWRVQKVMLKYRLQEWDLARGAIVCIGELTDCIPTSLVPKNEQRFGDFTPGRFAWKIEHVKTLLNPIEIRGKQGLWNWAPPLNLEFTEVYRA